MSLETIMSSLHAKNNAKTKKETDEVIEEEDELNDNDEDEEFQEDEEDEEFEKDEEDHENILEEEEVIKEEAALFLQRNIKRSMKKGYRKSRFFSIKDHISGENYGNK